MPEVERRTAGPRVSCERGRIRLDEAGGSHLGNLVDLSAQGAGLRGYDVPTGPFDMTVFSDGEVLLKTKCRVVNHDTNKSMWQARVGVKFDHDLSASQLTTVLSKLCRPRRWLALPEYRIATTDHKEVCEEIRSIQACRSNIFTAMIGAITLATFTVWGFYLQGLLNWTGVCVGMLMTYAVFVVGVLATVEKARAINLRRGFLAALAPYLRGELSLSNYWGWAQFKNLPGECGSLRESGKCPRFLGRKGVKDACRDEGEAIAAGITSRKRLFTGLLDSFTSLSSSLYVFMYAVIVSLLAYSLSQTLLQRLPIAATVAGGGPIDHWKILLCFAIGAAFGVIVVRKWYCFLLVFVGAVVMTWVTGVQPAHHILIYRLAFGVMGAIFGGLGWFLLRELWGLRVGKFSFETNAYAWFTVIQHCDPVPKDAGLLPVRRGWVDKMPESLRKAWWLFVGHRSHRCVRHEYKKARKRRTWGNLSNIAD